jgi:hypothetical protein
MSRHVWLVLMLATGSLLVGGRTAAGQVTAAADPGTAAPAAKPAAAESDAAKPAAAPDQAPSPAPDSAAGQKESAPLPTEGNATLKSTPGSKALGMSILGNQEAPTSLVIVPWKGSELGDSPGISLLLDDARQPVDKDVFMRALRYYDLRSEKKP